ncbi:hypothetical protein BBI17_009730 [Phytophthora kernoviae]|uniref:Uncharacterized protein n=1 Tax=Phytophthora kernoviae TaxID=325452 RepID=A0A421FCA3_9STRA|nr:hypothetical protein BBI17_009730 [Phytophthora kernoviae]
MFAANCAVYNKLVARSAEDQKTRLAAKVDNMSWAEFDDKYQPIASLRHISKYFRNKKAIQRHKAVNDEVRDSAFRDFIKATKASIAGFFAAKSRNEKTMFPEMRFKSKFAPSNTIEIAKRSVSRVQRDGNECIRFHPKFFGFNKSDGIVIHEDLPEVTMSSSSERVCAVDPGVRNFATVYDPDGRTFSVTDSKSIMMNKFKVIDQMKSLLKCMDNASKAKHQDRKRTKNK